MDTKSQNSTKPVLYMTLGYPGAGKTFFARQYADKKGLALVSADRLRFELFESPNFSQDEDRIVVALMDYMIEQFLNSNISVLVDGLNSQRVRRHNLRDMARKYNARPLVVWVQTDLDTSFDRASARDRRQSDDKYTVSIDEDTFEKLASKVKKPQHEDYVVISGKHVFQNQLNAVEKKVQQLKASSSQQQKTTMLGGRVDLSRRSNGRVRHVN